MVGIHARTGREKIFAQQIAHVLNDETQRKYIQVETLSVQLSSCVFHATRNHTFLGAASRCKSRATFEPL